MEKKNLWEGVVILPFINESNLVLTLDNMKTRSTLNDEENTRNSFGKDVTFFSYN